MVVPNQSIIEIGVGTGLLLEQLLKIDPQYNLTGMDHTAAMLEIAKERLGDRAKLFEADIISMSIPEEFDVAISNGGLFQSSRFSIGRKIVQYLKYRAPLILKSVPYS